MSNNDNDSAPHYFPLVTVDHYDRETGETSTDTIRNKTGRKPIKITEEICNKAKMLATQGNTDQDIAYCLGMGKTTFYEKKAEFPAFREAMEVGRALGIAQLKNKVHQLATNGNFQALKFQLGAMERKQKDGTIQIIVDEVDAQM